MPDRPRTDPGARNYRTGLLEVTRFAQGSSDGYSEVVTDVGSFELEDPDQLREALPVIAPSLAAAVQLAEQHPGELIVEVIQALVVAADTVVVVMPAQLRVEVGEEPFLAPPAVLTTPGLEARQRGAVLAPGGPAFQHRLPPATTPPAELESQEFERPVPCRGLTRELQQLRLLGCDFQTERRQARTQHAVEALGIGGTRESAHEVVRIPTEERLALAVRLDRILEPHIQGIVKIDVSEDR